MPSKEASRLRGSAPGARKAIGPSGFGSPQPVRLGTPQKASLQDLDRLPPRTSPVGQGYAYRQPHAPFPEGLHSLPLVAPGHYSSAASTVMLLMPGPVYGCAPGPRTLNLYSFSIGCTILMTRNAEAAASSAARPWPRTVTRWDAKAISIRLSSPLA